MNARRFIAVAALVVFARGAGAAELFRQEKTPGGLTFWHLQRPEANRSTIIGSFVDVFALNHPDKKIGRAHV